MDSTNTLHWMHISDLHRGQERTEEVWAVVRQEIHDDIKRQVQEAGSLDLVIFSGDLAYKGGKDEFLSVQHELEKLWDVFGQLNQKPRLFVVPGNHDLERPSKTSALLNLADLLRLKIDVRTELLSTKPSAYREEVVTAFANYTSFIANLKAVGIPLAEDTAGLFPGDSSVRFSVNGLAIGIVGLNSAWTHLGAGDLQGKLDISVTQLNSVVANDLPQWAMQNHVNLLITHHPADWLNEEAQAEFNGEIFNPKYFDAHLFGHMHDNAPKLSIIGAHQRRSIQAASLFGLEKIASAIDRRHGYYFAKLNAVTEICAYWPRRFEQKAGKIWQISTDGQLLNRDDRYFEQSWNVRKIEGVDLKKA